MMPKLTEYIPHDPTAKQKAFLLLECREVFYGGAGGGGKSDALLMAALQYVDVPGYAALLLRRTFSDLALPEAIMSRSMEWLSGTDAKWSSQSKEWTFPSGATVTFGYLQSERDKYRYQSAAFQYVGFDELTQFTETQYRYLFSRLRRLKGVSIPIRMRSASNPGNIGHEWVKQRFLEDGKLHGRPFIPARIEDNPYLDKAEYEKSLDQLDPVTREQIKHGDWKIIAEGAIFKRKWFLDSILYKMPLTRRKVRSWDLATSAKQSSDPTVGGLLSMSQGDLIVENIVKGRWEWPEGKRIIMQTAKMDGQAVEIGVEAVGMQLGMVQELKAELQKDGYRVIGISVDKDKYARALPVVALAEEGKVKLMHAAWNQDFLDVVCSFTGLGTEHDDEVDVLSQGYKMLDRGSPDMKDLVLVGATYETYKGY